MLLSLLSDDIKILSSFFFLFLVMLSSFLIIPVVRKTNKVKLGIVNPTGTPTILAN